MPLVRASCCGAAFGAVVVFDDSHYLLPMSAGDAGVAGLSRMT
ncbi:hypothetical protein BRPE64_ACDS25100 [Caballeronia insecticola]|uniref:Uncharacterized protein n=1 Tax=Caballeronia insecticola TaxID=758793 RepID=R4WIY4_9BURK|nr:hypothetical protein BRPE64_ACDS25100 [Caballeronia insecticola]